MSVAPQECLVDLLEMEASSFMYLDGVSTVTFFDGPAPIQQLKDRLVQVVQASPWLCGKLVKNKGKVQLAFEKSPSAEFILDKLYQEISDLDIFDESCDELIKKLQKTTCHVKETGFALLKKKLHFTRFTVAKKSGTLQKWALIFSMSHTVADGYTYYKTLSMLSKDSEITTMTAERKESFAPKVKAAVGEREWATVMGAPALILNYIGTLLFGKKPRVKAFYVDEEKVGSSGVVEIGQFHL